MKPINNREPSTQVDPQFLDRWSPRALSNRAISDDIIQSLFEAARWSPSCFNEQPWYFLYADDEETLSYFRPLLVDKNREWADQAPLLIFVISKKNFKLDNSLNKHNQFDAGAAWMSLALQARKYNLYAHAMAGIHYDQVYDVLNIPIDKYDVLCGIAVGYIGDPTSLSDDLREMESPNDRKPLNEICKKGKF